MGSKVIDVEAVKEEPAALTKAAEADALEIAGVIGQLDYTTPHGREEASEALGEVKQKIDDLDELEESIAGPIAKGLKNVRALFKKPRTKLQQCEKEIKQGIAAGLRASEEAAALALQAAHEAGDADAMAAVELDKPSGISVRALPRVRFVDAALLCRERPDLAEPAHAKVLAALGRGETVPGAELYFEDSVTKR